MQTDVRDAVRYLVDKMDANASQGPERAVFLLQDTGGPDPDTRRLGESLHSRWGLVAIRAVADEMTALGQRMPWWKRGDLAELDHCWDGIGDWRS